MIARLEFLGRLLADIVALVPEEQHAAAAVLAEASGHQIDRLLEESHADGVREGIAAAQAAAQPDAILAELREKQDKNLQGMLEAFVQITPPEISH